MLNRPRLTPSGTSTALDLAGGPGRTWGGRHPRPRGLVRRTGRCPRRRSCPRPAALLRRGRPGPAPPVPQPAPASVGDADARRCGDPAQRTVHPDRAGRPAQRLRVRLRRPGPARSGGPDRRQPRRALARRGRGRRAGTAMAGHLADEGGMPVLGGRRPPPRRPRSSSAPGGTRRSAARIGRHPEVGTVIVSEHVGGDVLLRGRRTKFGTQVRGYARGWTSLPRAVRRILVVRDVPVAAPGTMDCVVHAMARRVPAGPACAMPRAWALPVDPAAIAAQHVRSRRIRLIDMTSFFCSTRMCFPVIGGALVHKDTGHMTAVYATSLGPYLDRAVGPYPQPGPPLARSTVRQIRPSSGGCHHRKETAMRPRSLCRPRPASPSRSAARRSGALGAIVVLGLVLAALTGGSSAVAGTARTCSTPKYPGVGYFTSLRVTGVGCATGQEARRRLLPLPPSARRDGRTVPRRSDALPLHREAQHDPHRDRRAGHMPARLEADRAHLPAGHLGRRPGLHQASRRSVQIRAERSREHGRQMALILEDEPAADDREAPSVAAHERAQVDHLHAIAVQPVRGDRLAVDVQRSAARHRARRPGRAPPGDRSRGRSPPLPARSTGRRESRSRA